MFNESGTHRLNLLLEAPRSLLEAFADLDEWLCCYLIENSARVFKKPMMPEQIRSSYASCIRPSDKGYPSTLKTKVDLTGGKHSLCVWDSNGDEVGLPESWRNRLIRPRLRVSHMWFMGSAFGVVVRLTDALLRPDEDAAPAERKSPF